MQKCWKVARNVGKLLYEEAINISGDIQHYSCGMIFKNFPRLEHQLMETFKLNLVFLVFSNISLLGIPQLRLEDSVCDSFLGGVWVTDVCMFYWTLRVFSRSALVTSASPISSWQLWKLASCIQPLGADDEHCLQWLQRPWQLAFSKVICKSSVSALKLLRLK